MKQSILFLFSITILFTSCIKDRLQPSTNPTGPVVTTGDSLMYFWNFNGNDTSNHNPDISIGSGASFSYVAAYIDYNDGSTLNLPDSTTPAGNCLRVRNP